MTWKFHNFRKTSASGKGIIEKWINQAPHGCSWSSQLYTEIVLIKYAKAAAEFTRSAGSKLRGVSPSDTHNRLPLKARQVGNTETEQTRHCSRMLSQCKHTFQLQKMFIKKFESIVFAKRTRELKTAIRAKKRKAISISFIRKHTETRKFHVLKLISGNISWINHRVEIVLASQCLSFMTSHVHFQFSIHQLVIVCNLSMSHTDQWRGDEYHEIRYMTFNVHRNEWSE